MRNNLHENREISGASRSEQDRDRPAKAQSHKAGMHAPEKSDRAVLPMNQPNKGEQAGLQPFDNLFDYRDDKLIHLERVSYTF